MPTVLSKRELDDVTLCARTIAWCAGLPWAALPEHAPAGAPWENCREQFYDAALEFLGFRSSWSSLVRSPFEHRPLAENGGAPGWEPAARNEIQP